jgi:diguanylate cyclase (GGDEF)-like protein
MMRRKHKDHVRKSVDLGGVLSEIIAWAERFVPSESGSVLLDDPVLKRMNDKDDRLYFAACFGAKSEDLVGSSIATGEGIAGKTYLSGESYISEDVTADTLFQPEVDKRISYRSVSIIASPILINGGVIGVIELVNRRDRSNYDMNDLQLLEVFAGYTANLIENALAARDFEELSKHDNLTGLFNDRYFYEILEGEVERVEEEGGDTALIFFDLDRFKEINDTYGHLAGSLVLREVADIVKEIFWDTNAVCVRYGGDEYAVVLPQTKVDVASDYAEKVRDKIENSVFLKKSIRPGDEPIRISGSITASVGVASQSVNVLPRGDSRVKAESLLRAADNAMYMAKDLGKNRVFTAG